MCKSRLRGEEKLRVAFNLKTHHLGTAKPMPERETGPLAIDEYEIEHPVVVISLDTELAEVNTAHR
jgi:hypothetical protein